MFQGNLILLFISFYFDNHRLIDWFLFQTVDPDPLDHCILDAFEAKKLKNDQFDTLSFSPFDPDKKYNTNI